MNILDFLNCSVTSIQAVDSIKNILTENNFKEIQQADDWSILKQNEKYFFTVNDGAILAFTSGESPKSFRIINSHSDSPCFRVKPRAQLTDENYTRINVEVFGSPIYSTWMDRPLSVAGRVFTRTDNPFKPKKHLVNIDKDLLVMPNLAIHLNRDANSGYEYKAHKDLIALMSTSSNKDEFKEVLAEEINEDPNNIVDFDLFLYAREKASYLGSRQEFISSGRLDNLAMAYASTMAIVEAESSDINIAFIAGNEEIGSMGIEGADSPLLSDSLMRLCHVFDLDYARMIANSFVVSADMAHGIHPNHPELADQNNYPKINQGPVVKYSGRKSYMSDGYTSSVFRNLASGIGVNVQTYTNRSDQRGGITIGPINTNHLNIPVVDVGNATLAMHSVRELAGRDDLEDMIRVFVEFYNY